MFVKSTVTCLVFIQLEHIFFVTSTCLDATNSSIRLQLVGLKFSIKLLEIFSPAGGAVGLWLLTGPPG